MIDISDSVPVVSRGQDMGCSQKLMSTHGMRHDLFGFSGPRLFPLQYHLQRLSKLFPSRQNAFSLSMSKESYSLQQRLTLFRLQSNLFLHLNDLPLSLQALQHLQCYIRLKLYCLKHSQGLHTLQNLQEVNFAGNLITKIGK